MVPSVAHSRVTVLNSIFGRSGHICSIEHSTIFSTPSPPPSPWGGGGDRSLQHPTSLRYISNDQSRTLVALLHIHFFCWEPPPHATVDVCFANTVYKTVAVYSYPPVDEVHPGAMAAHPWSRGGSTCNSEVRYPHGGSPWSQGGFPGAMAAHLGAQEAQHGARKLESHMEAHPGAMEAFQESCQLILEQRRLNMESGSSKAMVNAMEVHQITI